MPTLNEEIAAQNYARNHGWNRDAYGNLVEGGGGGGAMGNGAPNAGPGYLPGSSLPGTYNPNSGGIPATTSPGSSMQQLIDSIAGNSSKIGDLISNLTQASSKALRDQYGPDYFNILNTVSANTLRRAKGDITDLLPDIQRKAAERAVASGQVNGQQVNAKIAQDFGLSIKDVEDKALSQLGEIRGATPVVSPYDFRSLIPTIGDWLHSQERADTLASAPVPENVYNRNLQNIMGGLAGGRAAGYNGGSRGPGGPSLPSGPSLDSRDHSNEGRVPNQSAQIPAQIVQKYNPNKAWGETWSTDENGQTGNYGATGPVPGNAGPVQGGGAWTPDYSWMNDPFNSAGSGSQGGSTPVPGTNQAQLPTWMTDPYAQQQTYGAEPNPNQAPTWMSDPYAVPALDEEGY